MTVSWLLKPSSTSILIFLLMTLLTSACSTENSAAPSHSKASDSGISNSNKPKDTKTNYPAVISGTDNGSITEDYDPDGDNLLEVSGKLNITDSNIDEAAFIATIHSGNYGSLTIDAAGYWYYAADNNQSLIQDLASSDTLTDSLTIASVDGTTHAVTITIKGVNEPVTTDTRTTDTSTTDTTTTDTTTATNSAAFISGTDKGNVTEDLDSNNDGLLGASGKLNISDSDTGEAFFVATTVNSNYGSINIDASGNWFYGAINSLSIIQNLNSNDILIDSLTVASIDGTTHAVTITIKGVDEPATTDTTADTGTTDTNQPSGTVADIILSWVAPAEREDNTAISLSEIAGYKIYYGTTQGGYSDSVDINDGSAQGYTFKDFSAGTYYFVVTTYDTKGRESQYSSEIKIVI